MLNKPDITVDIHDPMDIYMSQVLTQNEEDRKYLYQWIQRTLYETEPNNTMILLCRGGEDKNTFIDKVFSDINSHRCQAPVPVLDSRLCIYDGGKREDILKLSAFCSGDIFTYRPLGEEEIKFKSTANFIALHDEPIHDPPSRVKVFNIQKVQDRDILKVFDYDWKRFALYFKKDIA
jgi:hypothetical protein